MSKKISGIFLSRTSRTMHPDMTCDKCAQQFKVGINSENKDIDWKSYMLGYAQTSGPFMNLQSLCPQLIKTVIEYSGHIVCTKCDDGLLHVTEESRFDIDVLLDYLK